MKRPLLLSLLFSLPSMLVGQSFQVDFAPNPPGVDPQVGAMEVLADGRLIIAYHRGEVMIFNPEDETWTRFAEGLHEPLGMLVEEDGSILVMQRPELTRLRDIDGDDKADIYETVFDGFGMSGNYHEFAFGPVKGPDGSLYIALNVASNQAGVRPEIRGPWSDIGYLDFEQMQNGRQWGRVKDQAGRMYARVAYRGCILKLSPDGSTAEVFATGLRSPDGIAFDAEGRLLVDDNQGDWLGTSHLYVIEEGNFYGHVASLVWRKDWDGRIPLDVPVEELDAMRSKPNAVFPHGELANSPTQPIVMPDSWGPYAGQVVIGEMNQPHLVRFLPDEINGYTQGTLVAFLRNTGIGNGNHRIAFTDDGRMWLGKTHLAWSGGEGMAVVQPQDIEKSFTVTSVQLEKSGDTHAFRIGLSQPVESPGSPEISRFGYIYRAQYGSPKVNESRATPSAVSLSDDGRELVIEVEVYEGLTHAIDLSDLQSEEGRTLDATTLYYQANRLP